MFLAEGVEVRLRSGVVRCGKALCRARKAAHAEGHDIAERDALIEQACAWRELGLRQPAPLGELGKVDQQRVAGESRAAHVGRVAWPDSAQRQDLPQPLPGADQPVDEVAGTVT